MAHGVMFKMYSMKFRHF